MIKEIKIKIIDVLKKMNESKATILGVIAFFEKRRRCERHARMVRKK